MNVYQFKSKEAFLAAFQRVKDDKRTKVYTPYAVEEVLLARENLTRPLNVFFFAGGILGILIAIFITCYPNMVSYPINVGGKPLFSWPAFIVILFELMILLSGLAAVGGFFYLNDYPSMDKEIFALEAFNKQRHEDFFLTNPETLDVDADQVYYLPADAAGM